MCVIVSVKLSSDEKQYNVCVCPLGAFSQNLLDVQDPTGLHQDGKKKEKRKRRVSKLKYNGKKKGVIVNVKKKTQKTKVEVWG